CPLVAADYTAAAAARVIELSTERVRNPCVAARLEAGETSEMSEGATRRPIAILLASQWTSLLGVVLAPSAGLCWLIAIPASARHHVDTAYIGILLYLILPVVFFAGLALMPIGIALSRRQISSGWKAVPDHAQALRTLGLFFGVTTLANAVIGSQVVY